MKTELPASTDAPMPSIQPAELPPRVPPPSRAAAAGTVGALGGAILLVAFSETIWSGSPSTSKDSSVDSSSQAATADWVDPITALGTVELDEEHVATVTTLAGGLVKHISSFEGDAVRKGAVLATLEPATLHLGQRLHEVSKNYELLSPIDGVVVDRALSPTAEVGPELLAFRVADLSHLKIEFRVPEPASDRIRAGDRIELRPIAARELALRTTVSAVLRQGDQAIVRVHVLDPHHHLRAGDAVQAGIFVSDGEVKETTLL